MYSTRYLRVIDVLGFGVRAAFRVSCVLLFSLVPSLPRSLPRARNVKKS